jgi:membrane associated rhomboid family serine protease
MERRIAWPPFTTNIKITLGVLLVFFLASLPSGLYDFISEYLLLSRDAVVSDYQVWTLLTYALFHHDFGHILFNGVALWMFGSYLDQIWESNRFWTHSLLCALGGGVIVVISQLIFGMSVPTLGYSGAVMGLIAAFAWYNWNRRINLFFFPMTGKWMLVLFLGIDIFMVVIARQPVSIAGHLGGMATGMLLVTDYWRPRKLKQLWRRWKTKRNIKVVSDNPDRKRNGKWVN